MRVLEYVLVIANVATVFGDSSGLNVTVDFTCVCVVVGTIVELVGARSSPPE